MSNSAPTIAVRGIVATTPRHLVTESGMEITSFRLVCTPRRLMRGTTGWEDGESCWFTVCAFRQLAANASACIARGDPVLVSGRLCLREWQGDQHGVTAEIEADSIGHDLARGCSTFVRSIAERTLSAGATPDDSPARSP